MSWAGVAVGVGGAVIGAMNSSDAADNASDAQVQAGREANALQLKMFEEGRADQQPWRDRGNAAGNLLQYYLGIDPNGASGGASARDNNYGLGAAPTIDQFTRQNSFGGGGQWYTGNTDSGRGSTMPAEALFGRTTGTTVDQAGYNQALSQYNSKLEAAKAAEASRQHDALLAAQGDPRFGSLLKQFTGDSVATDPGYQFGLQQGTQAVTNQRAALGSLLSGATLKDLTQFGNDYGGTKFNEAWTRDQGNKTLINNMLAGVSGTGQTTATNIANQGNVTGASMANNITGIGNARASGYIGSANAVNSMIGTGINQYNSANLLKSLNNRPNSGVGPYDPGVTKPYYDDLNT